MKSFLFIIGLTLAVVYGVIAAAEEETEIFSDSFQSSKLSSEWMVHEGEWTIEKGALANKNGGLITLKISPGGCFVMEAELFLPSRWLSVIVFFTDPKNYATLYFLSNGFWESFIMSDNHIFDYIQHKDPEITTNRYHHIRIVSEFGVVSLFFDNKFKGLTVFPYQPGVHVGFRTLKKSGLFKIKNFSIKKMPTKNGIPVCPLKLKDFSNGVIYKDYEFEGKIYPSEELKVDDKIGVAELKYDFGVDKVFESCFVRIPIDVNRCKRVLMDVEGDGSKNNFFIILHDSSGEQHLVTKSRLNWRGWQEVGVNLEPFLKSPDNMERLAIHWGGDKNQKIDFPLKAIDIGVAKRKTKINGKLGFRNVRFIDTQD